MSDDERADATDRAEQDGSSAETAVGAAGNAPLEGHGDVTATLPDPDRAAAALGEDEAGERGGDDGGATPAAAGVGATGIEGRAGTGAGSADGVGTTEADRRVLEFTLDNERFCLDIEHIEEIVETASVTRVPNTPEFVEGVVDLRGQITTILDPKIVMDRSGSTAGEHVVVFDPDAFDDQGHVGWVVDDVDRVAPVDDDRVSEAPVESEFVEGVVEREEEFVVWIAPDLGLDELA